VKDEYKDAFIGADKVFWLPTYLTREDESLKVLTPEDFIAMLDNRDVAEAAELDDDLEKKLRKLIAEDYIVLLMTAGPADGWMREKFGDKN
jgi:UDP-N-acetylmuramate--alanine ligase